MGTKDYYSVLVLGNGMQLTKDNFDFEDIKFVSESTIEHDDSKYDHWELTIFLPKSMSRGDVENLTDKIIKSTKAYDELYPVSGGCTSLSVKEVMGLQELKQRLEEFKTTLETGLNFASLNHTVVDPNCTMPVKSILQKMDEILKGDSTS
ncbi:MAG: hypothetical protein KGL95_00245 [Patescibacteria group bacterium]|nr:hypothetical protein [Patescibacteria group bacterium]